MWAAQAGYLAAPLSDQVNTSRAKVLDGVGLEAPMPGLETDFEWRIVAVLGELGWCGSDSMGGAVSITASEFRDWCWATGEDLTQWEGQLVLRCSRAYAAGVMADKAPFEPLNTKIALVSAEAMREG